MPASDALAVVVVAHNSAAHLPKLLDALCDQLRQDDQLVIVDNASTDDTAAIASGRLSALGPAGRYLHSPENLGFGGGCHLGVGETEAPLLLFVNPDCVPLPGCLERLRAAAAAHPQWAAWQAAVLMPDGRINTDGGVVHFLGIGWAGDCGKPVSALPASPREVAFPSGAAMMVRRAAWEQLGGLDPSYFLYCEDLDFGLRLWLAGYGSGVVPEARMVHDYEFDKGPLKWFWLERNRWRTVLSVYPAPLLVLLAPALLCAELAIHFAAAIGGWLPAKLRADVAVLRDLPRTLGRRRAVQATRRIGTRRFASLLRSSLDSSYLAAGLRAGQRR